MFEGVKNSHDVFSTSNRDCTYMGILSRKLDILSIDTWLCGFLSRNFTFCCVCYCVYIYIYLYMYMCVCMYIYMCVRVCIYMCVYIYVCVSMKRTSNRWGDETLDTSFVGRPWHLH